MTRTEVRRVAIVACAGAVIAVVATACRFSDVSPAASQAPVRPGTTRAWASPGRIWFGWNMTP